jgi:hypothetical protein
MKKITLIALMLAVLLTASMLPATATSSETTELKNCVVKSYGNMKYACISVNFPTSLSLEDLDSIRNQVISEYKTEKGISIISATYSVPEIPKSGEIVAYCFKINGDGTASQYVGIAGDNESVSVIHEEAKKWYHDQVVDFDENKKINYANQTSDYLLSSESREEWRESLHSCSSYYKNPYGGVTNNYELYVLMNDSSSTSDWFAIVQEFSMEPGYKAWSGSPWKNDVGRLYHEWSSGTVGNAQLFDFWPNGPFTRKTTETTIIPGRFGDVLAAFMGGYSQPDVSTQTDSSSITDIGEWKLTCNNNAAKKSTVVMYSKSTCSANQHSSGTYYILDVVATGVFRESLFSSKVLSATSSPRISYDNDSQMTLLLKQ